MRLRNTILLLYLFKLLFDFLIEEPRLQASAVDVAVKSKHNGRRFPTLELVVSTILPRSTPEMGEVTMTAQAMST